MLKVVQNNHIGHMVIDEYARYLENNDFKGFLKNRKKSEKRPHGKKNPFWDLAIQWDLLTVIRSARTTRLKSPDTFSFILRPFSKTRFCIFSKVFTCLPKKY